MAVILIVHVIPNVLVMTSAIIVDVLITVAALSTKIVPVKELVLVLWSDVLIMMMLLRCIYLNQKKVKKKANRSNNTIGDNPYKLKSFSIIMNVYLLDSYGHLVPSGQEERYYKNNNLWPGSKFEYEDYKRRTEREKTISDILKESRNTPKLSPSFNISNVLNTSKEIPLISREVPEILPFLKKNR